MEAPLHNETGMACVTSDVMYNCYARPGEKRETPLNKCPVECIPSPSNMRTNNVEEDDIDGWRKWQRTIQQTTRLRIWLAEEDRGFYIAQCPVRRTAQSALQFPMADLFSPTPTVNRLRWEAFHPRSKH